MVTRGGPLFAKNKKKTLFIVELCIEGLSRIPFN
jgi:hypothetical protein